MASWLSRLSTTSWTRSRYSGVPEAIRLLVRLSTVSESSWRSSGTAVSSAPPSCAYDASGSSEAAAAAC